MYNRTYKMTREYEWDPEKARANQRKHGVRFLDAVGVFQDDRMVMVEDTYPLEQRFVSIGADGLGRVLVVVFTWRAQRVRLISARKANKQERQVYEGG